MTDFAQDGSAVRSRGPPLPKLNLLPASHFLQRHPHPSKSQHPLDSSNDLEIDLDMEMDFDTTVSSSGHAPSDAVSSARPFLSAHPSPEVSDDSDSDRERSLGRNATEANPQTSAQHSVRFDDSASAVHSTKREQGRLRVEEHLREQAQSELSLSHHLFLAPIPIPQARTPPHSPHYHSGKRSSFSMQTPPGSASSVMPVPCSDSNAVDTLIREQVHANSLSHSTDKAFFWHVGQLSDFSFSDRFVRSRVFEVTDAPAPADKEHMATNTAAAVGAADTRVSATNQPKSTWRLRLYPHGRGDRHRDSEYVGLYLQQEVAGAAALTRRGSAIPAAVSAPAFSSSAPTPFTSRGSISPTSRRSISGASSLPMVRRHVTLFIATESGDCLAKQDLVEWFSGGEGGLGFPRIVSRKAVHDAVKSSSIIDDEEEEREIGIVAGVIFHDL
ncbi:hypothetical protein BGZ67_000261 [Mortierella alpina]|nr:hypothetical protein BGZ67_000261 [Mortierella alpina]